MHPLNCIDASSALVHHEPPNGARAHLRPSTTNPRTTRGRVPGAENAVCFCTFRACLLILMQIIITKISEREREKKREWEIERERWGRGDEHASLYESHYTIPGRLRIDLRICMCWDLAASIRSTDWPPTPLHLCLPRPLPPPAGLAYSERRRWLRASVHALRVQSVHPWSYFRGQAPRRRRAVWH